MAKDSKRGDQSSRSVIDFGKERKKKIADFRAKRQLADKPIPTLEEAVNILVDKALELESELALKPV